MQFCAVPVTNQPTAWEPSPSWETKSHSAGQEIFTFHGTQSFNYHAYKSLPLDLSQMNRVHNLT
jgi:hypothetical protein